MNSLRNTTRKLYSFSFLDSFILIYPLYAVFLGDSGMNPGQITLLFAAWSVTAFLLEVPSGSLADKFPRKNILFIGVVAKALGLLLWIIYPSFWGFLLGFMLWGVKTAFTSGTKEALVYDELAARHKAKSYTKIMGRMDSWGLIGIILASTAAATLANHGYTPILVASVISVFLSAVVVLLLPSAKTIKEIDDARYITYFKKGVGLFKQDKKVRYFVSVLSILVGLAVSEEYFALLLREKGLSNTSIALWSGVLYASAAAASALAYKIKTTYQHAEWFIFLWAILLAVATVSPEVMVPVLLALYMFILTVVQLHVSVAFQDSIPSVSRATTTSLTGFGSELFAMSAYIAFGISLHSGSYSLAFRVMSGLIIVCGLILFVIKPKRKVLITD